MTPAPVTAGTLTARHAVGGSRTAAPPPRPSAARSGPRSGVRGGAVGLPPGMRLTPPELRVVAAVADGLTNSQVGRRLSLSPLTVKQHLHRISQRTGVGDRAGIVAFALRTGQLPRRPLPPGVRVPPVAARCVVLLPLVAEGLSNLEAGVRLGVAEETVKSRLVVLFRQFGAVSRANLVRLAVDADVLRIAPDQLETRGGRDS